MYINIIKILPNHEGLQKIKKVFILLSTQLRIVKEFQAIAQLP